MMWMEKTSHGVAALLHTKLLVTERQCVGQRHVEKTYLHTIALFPLGFKR
jgi:hypothetical protein